MENFEVIEYEIWRKGLPLTLRNALGPSDMANMFTEDEKRKAAISSDVIGSINITNGTRSTQKKILLKSNWFTEEYYTIHDDGECLIIKKCYMHIPKNAHKMTKCKHISIEHSEISNGEYYFDVELSTEDDAHIYYR